jgi:cell division protein FtsB
MFDFHEKRRIRSILYSKWLIGGIFLISSLLSVSVYHRYTVAHDMKEKLEHKKAELQELEQRATVLETKVEYLDDERGVEEELRNRFDVVKEGEQMVVLIDEREPKATINKEDANNTLQTADQNWSLWEFLKFW